MDAEEEKTRTAAQTEEASMDRMGNPWDDPATFALFIAEQLDGDRSYAKIELLIRTASSLAESGENERALLVANQAESMIQSIDIDGTKAEFLMDLSPTLINLGENQKALPIAEQSQFLALRMSTDVATLLTEMKVIILLRIGKQFIALDKQQKALEIANEVKKACDDIQVKDDGDFRIKVTALKDLAAYLMELGEKEEARLTVKLAQDLLIQQQMTDQEQLASSIAAIGAGLAVIGEEEEGFSEMMRAVKQTDLIEDPDTEALLLTQFASFLGEPARRQESISLLNRAIEKSKMIDDESDKILTLSFIAVTQGRLAEKRETLVTLEEIVEIAKRCDDSDLNVLTFVEVASEFFELGESEQGLSVLKEAVEVARTNELFDREIAIMEIAHTLCTQPVPKSGTPHDIYRFKRRFSEKDYRMKKSFTEAEKLLAREIAESLQPN